MSMTANQNHDVASYSAKRIKTCDNDNVRPWSDLNHDVLSLVMMQLGFVDFFSFCGVCKSMRSVALANRKRFMASKPPMLMHISNPTTLSYNDKECCLEDYEGRKLKTIVPNSVCSTLVGSTCGYLIFFRWFITCDFRLVNPITRHEFHFPRVPFDFYGTPRINAVLVFSPSISRYVFVMLDIDSNFIWYSIADKGAWYRVSSIFRITGLHVFKKKIYTICSDANSWEVHLRELTLNPKPELTLVETKNFLHKDYLYSSLLLLSWGESLYYVESLLFGNSLKVHKLDFGKMEWEKFEDTRDKHEPAIFLSNLKYGAAVKSESWADSGSQHIHQRFVRHGRFFTANQWYFPHECLNVNLLDES